jgi:hypothetical protein
MRYVVPAQSIVGAAVEAKHEAPLPWAGAPCCCPEAAVCTECAVAAKSHLSPLLRCAWDSGHLPTLDMHHHLQATATHISLIAHMGE